MPENDTNDHEQGDGIVIDEEVAEEIPIPLAQETEPPLRDPRTIDIPESLPLLPIRNAVAFPGTIMPLNIVRDASKRVLDLALAGDRLICAVAQRVPEQDDPRLDDLYRVGTACLILKMYKMPDGTEMIVVHGIARVGIEYLTREQPQLEARVHARLDPDESSVELEALMHNARHAAHRIIELSPNVPQEARQVLDGIRTPGGLADFLAANLSLGVVHKQEILETFDVATRLRKVHASMAGQLDVLELSQKIQSQVRDQLDKSQREHYLREQLKAIQKELGQDDGRVSEIEKLRTQVQAAKMPAPVQTEADRELRRMANLHPASPEYSVALDYVTWLASLPWAARTKDRLDLRRAEKILNEDHYDLDRIKRRILEFLAVRKLKPDGRGPILCFTGPPGVGKTSLGRSIARSLGREFIRISLGGIRDEAEIRGHRRTYIGALPGRIIQEIRKIGSNNPVFMLDEVDKIGQDFRGDPASALLEVLDPQQNQTFTDHYLDVAFDLSGVLFIATANYADPVPLALLDRMEVIGLSGYTLQEKLEIAKRYLVPRQLEENGLTPENVRLDEDALTTIVTSYTREAGVRSLERQIGSICRARAAAIVRGSKKTHRITSKSVAEDLGPPLFEPQAAATESIPGVVTGLAFTPTGGDILFVEASLMPGNANLNLTGQLGDVMRESAQAAFSIIRSRADKLGIDAAEVLRHDYHVHVPAGAVPKDGPSAGAAIFTALVSVLTGRCVDPGTGITGEITLRGRVLPVGGVKEKVLAAHRAGLHRVILPARNQRDLHEIPQDIRNQLEFVFAQTTDDVLANAFGRCDAKPAAKPKRKAATKKRRKAAQPAIKINPRKQAAARRAR
jgi:ATP-dependent Lon protease